MAKQTSKGTSVFTSFAAAEKERVAREAAAKGKSAKNRYVYRVVRLTDTKRPRYTVCATPWAYRLQQQERGVVMAIDHSEAA